MHLMRLLLLFCASLIFQFDQPKSAYSQSVDVRSTPIPLAIIAEAKRRLIPLSAIKLSGRQWVACLQNHLREEACITLGEDLPAQSKVASGNSTNVDGAMSMRLRYGDRLLIEQYGKQTREYSVFSGSQFASSAADIGTFVGDGDDAIKFQLRSDREARVIAMGRDGKRSLNSLPRFRREGSRLVRTSDVQLVSEYMSKHPQEPFLLVVTVPGLCEPCRRMDQVIQAAHEIERPDTTQIKTFVLEYFSFSEAELQLLGQGAVFPTTLVFPQVSRMAKNALPSLTIGFSPNNSIGDLSKICEKLKRGVPSAMARGVVSPESLQTLIQTSAGSQPTDRLHADR